MSKNTPTFGVLGFPTAFDGVPTALLRRWWRLYRAHISVLHFCRTPRERHPCVTGYNTYNITKIKPLSDQEAFPRRLHGVLKFPRTPREHQEKFILIVKKEAMASSPRPRCVQSVATEFALRSTAFLRSSRWRFMALARRFHCACASLLVYALRFHGVRTALSRRSGTALTICSQNRNEV